MKTCFFAKLYLRVESISLLARRGRSAPAPFDDRNSAADDRVEELLFLKKICENPVLLSVSVLFFCEQSEEATGVIFARRVWSELQRATRPVAVCGGSFGPSIWLRLRRALWIDEVCALPGFSPAL
jgi:hypothetical protein